MAGYSNNENEMITMVKDRLMETNLKLENPEMIARNLLSQFDYDLERVLELAI